MRRLSAARPPAKNVTSSSSISHPKLTESPLTDVLHQQTVAVARVVERGEGSVVSVHHLTTWLPLVLSVSFGVAVMSLAVILFLYCRRRGGKTCSQRNSDIEMMSPNCEIAQPSEAQSHVFNQETVYPAVQQVCSPTPTTWRGWESTFST